MKFFVDTANLQEIELIESLGVLDGVTTNPSLMAKEGITGKDQILKHYKTIAGMVPNGDISAEVLSVSYDDMIVEGEELASIAPNIVVKVPMTQDGVRAIKFFHAKGIRTNCTLIFSATQAMIAAKAGANYVSPFIGRLDDISFDGLQLIEDITTIFSNYGYDTEVLAASIRHNVHILTCAKIGADVVTCPAKVILSMFHHPLTQSGLEKFIEDSHKMLP